MIKKPFEMTFEEFASLLQLGGVVNRLPEMNRGVPVYSYSVFMTGKLAEELPASSRTVNFKDVMVHALTQQLGLDRKSHRDNLKVCELVAARSAWLEVVSVEHHRNRAWGLDELSGDVRDDYDILSKGMLHPYIQSELSKQKLFSNGVQPVLASASRVVGKPVEDLAPDEISVGKVVSQSTNFTVQETTEGEIVTHENRRLGSIPKLGGDVSITYYQGSGQVIDSLENMKVSVPFIEEKSRDLAVSLVDGNGKEQVILFKSVVLFSKFVKTHGLDEISIEQAIDARIAAPKIETPKPVRELVSEVYVDSESGLLSVDFKENGMPYTTLFGSVNELENAAAEFGIGSAVIARGRALESQSRTVTDYDISASLDVLADKLAGLGCERVSRSIVNGRVYLGTIVEDSLLHVAHDIGRGEIVIHDKRNLDKVPRKNEKMTVKYENGRGRVEDLVRVPELGQGR